MYACVVVVSLSILKSVIIVDVEVDKFSARSWITIRLSPDARGAQCGVNRELSTSTQLGTPRNNSALITIRVKRMVKNHYARGFNSYGFISNLLSTNTLVE